MAGRNDEKSATSSSGRRCVAAMIVAAGLAALGAAHAAAIPATDAVSSQRTRLPAVREKPEANPASPPKAGAPASSQSAPVEAAGPAKQKGDQEKVEQQVPPPAAKPEDGTKSLDDLLGIPGKKPGASSPPGAEGAASDPALESARRRVRRSLDDEEVESLLQQILGDMRSSAQRLGVGADVGLDTQRVQQGVIDKLDVLIEQAQRRKQQGASSSSSSSSKSQRDRQSDGQAQSADEAGNQQPNDSATRSARQSQRGESQELEPPEGDESVAAEKLLDESRTEWGNLPARVRELIRQGSRDRMARLYQRLTEEYYRRMAEDASR